MADKARPFPPGSYPVVIIGSGPGGLQLSYSLRKHGIKHAVISADEGPGGMFRKWPQFQRLLSWTKPYAPDGPGSPRFERVDWNSLLADEPENKALQAKHMDGTSYFPSRAEIEASLTDFAERTAIAVRYGCRWESTARLDNGGDDRFSLATSDGEYRCRVVVFAVGVAEPFNPTIPGIEFAHHYADVRSAPDYAGRRVLIIGKRNSGFELASGLLPWAKAITLVSPSPTKLSVVTKSLVGVRARYLQPYEDSAIGGGCAILDAAVEGLAKADDGLRVTLRRTADSQIFHVTADDVINATGFITPLRDLTKIGVATFGQSKLPAQTDWWRSASVPGIFFAGTITQGAPSVGKFGIPPNSGAVHGHRYNSQILAKHIATAEFGKPANDPVISLDQSISVLLDDIGQSPALWHQRGYLARCILQSDGTGFADIGTIPLTTFIDQSGPDGAALALETDGTGAIYPVLYVRKGGAVSEHQLEPTGFSGQATPDQGRELKSALESLPS